VELAGYRQLSVNEKVTVMVVADPEPPVPLLPEARICGDVESAMLPPVQLPVSFEPSARELHWSRTAPAGTTGQLVSVSDAACTLTDQVPVPFPLICQLTDAVVLPATGEASGSEAVKAMFEGDAVRPLIVTLPWADSTIAPKNSAAGSRKHMPEPIRTPRS
jgi:hypothetical protein